MSDDGSIEVETNRRESAIKESRKRASCGSDCRYFLARLGPPMDVATGDMKGAGARRTGRSQDDTERIRK